MKRFRDFLHFKPATIVTDVPVHGKHSREDVIESNDKDTKISSNTMKFDKLHKPSLSEWKHLGKSYTKHPNDVHSDVHRSINDYTEQSAINKHLTKHASSKASLFDKTHEEYSKKRTKDEFDFSKQDFVAEKQKMETQARHLDHAIGSHKLKHDAVVYHGTSRNPDHYASQHPDRHVQFPSYLSTSASHHIAEGFSKSHDDDSTTSHSHVLRIHLPKGHEALPILNRSYHNTEHEVLLHRNSKFKIAENPVSVKTTKHHTVHYWDAHPVEDK